MSFWDGYFRSLKPLEVEEPIDVWVHRPPAYVLARILLPTPVSPNLVTLGSILTGLAGGAAIFVDFPGHLPLAGGLIFGSAVLDCCDGQLARLRKSSSVFGRMLDGIADSTVSGVVAVGGSWLVLQKYHEPLWLLLLTLVLAVTTILTSSFQTTMFDHFKNVFLRMTHPSFCESEDVSVAEARYQAQVAGMSFALKVAWGIYFVYIRSQRDYAQRFDSGARPLLDANPEFNERNAAIYRKHAAPLMRVWRRYFGFGSLVFGLAVSIGFNVVEYYLLYRLLLLNAVFYGYLRPAQRRASRLSLEEISSPA